MIGLADGWVAAAYWGCLLATVLCVVYGVLMRNESDGGSMDDDKKWAAEEDRVEKEL